MKFLLRAWAKAAGYRLVRERIKDHAIPDWSCYRPTFSPWFLRNEFAAYHALAAPYTLVAVERTYVLYTLALQAAVLDGEWYECGVYKGGTARMLGKLLQAEARHPRRKLHLFDTFEGMPETDPMRDLHRQGDLADTDVDSVRQRVEEVMGAQRLELHQGFIPNTFAGLEEHRIAFAHIDVDIYQSILDCCEFIYPRMLPGGFMVFDDYGFSSCPGARQAVDEFFADKPEQVLVLNTGQSVVFRAPD